MTSLIRNSQFAIRNCSLIRNSQFAIRNCSQGFTLVELLVVIGIIGILAGVLLTNFSGGSESARAARCLSNLKNLASACQTYGMQTGRYPNAGSVELMSMNTSKGRRRTETKYTERAGWISWNSRGRYPSQSHGSNATIGFYEDNAEDQLYALTNGCLWKYVSQNRETYVCPSHAKRLRNKARPNWSYLMNAYFGWDTTKGNGSFTLEGGGHTDFGRLPRADRFLLFSEIPFMGYGSWQPDGSGGSDESDAILQYSMSGLTAAQKGPNASADGNETIGANHMIGRNLFAHVAFADGHVEKVLVPYTGNSKQPQVDETQLKNLTTWLCSGLDVSFNGKRYQKLDN